MVELFTSTGEGFTFDAVIAPVSIKHGLRTTDYGLRTGYKTRTTYKTRTKGFNHTRSIAEKEKEYTESRKTDEL